MTATQTKAEKKVVTEWETTTVLTCDGCGEQWTVPKVAYSNPSGWGVLKTLESPSWYDAELPNHSVRHFHTLACLKGWAQTAEYLWIGAKWSHQDDQY